jgi:hypothetical protein
MSPGDWDACPWDVQRTYWDGLVAEKLIRVTEPRQQVRQPASRQVEGGADVIDIQALIKDARASQQAANG